MPALINIYRDVLFPKAFDEQSGEGRVLSQFLLKLCEAE